MDYSLLRSSPGCFVVSRQVALKLAIVLAMREAESSPGPAWLMTPQDCALRTSGQEAKTAKRIGQRGTDSPREEPMV